MTWTDPRTWVDGELVTASLLNTHLRDNLDAIGPHERLRASANEQVVNSTTYQPDDVLFWPILSGEAWGFHGAIMFSAGIPGHSKWRLNAPAGTTGFWCTVTENGAGTLGRQSGTFSGSPATAEMANIGATQTIFHFQGSFLAGGNGNLQLEFAQNALDAGTPLTRLPNSFFIATRLT